MGSPRATCCALAELTRLPAVLTTPGDALLGAACSGGVTGARRTAGLAVASALIYLGGMALNDYADRDLDARERPNRPIPSARISPATALEVAAVLATAGVASAWWADGGAVLPVLFPLVGAVASYDLLVKTGPAGPAAMAACRSLDVLMGAHPGRRGEALVPALLVGGHTLVITTVSRREVRGGSRRTGAGVLIGTGLVAAASWAVTARRPGPRSSDAPGLLAAGVLLTAFAASVALAACHAVTDPGPRAFQRVVEAGVLGLIPLQGALLAPTGPPWAPALLTGLWMAAGRRGTARSIT